MVPGLALESAPVLGSLSDGVSQVGWVSARVGMGTDSLLRA